jgi:hypothetical protein
LPKHSDPVEATATTDLASDDFIPSAVTVSATALPSDLVRENPAVMTLENLAVITNDKVKYWSKIFDH